MRREDTPAAVVSDIKRGTGLINQPKRLNVATSRAKDMLVIFGSRSLLCNADPHIWIALLQHCSIVA